MSKHFELMQRMEEEQSSPTESLPAPFSPPLGVQRKRNGQRRWANDEALRLVQQLFLLQTEQPPRVVVFAGIDHGNGCSQLCASAAEILAKNASRPVCLMEANFRSPGLSGLFGISNHEGLTDALTRKGSLSSCTK